MLKTSDLKVLVNKILNIFISIFNKNVKKDINILETLINNDRFNLNNTEFIYAPINLNNNILSEFESIKVSLDQEDTKELLNELSIIFKK